jgi:uncharacterized surface protein with fasciclin (FAS1) repeats
MSISVHIGSNFKLPPLLSIVTNSKDHTILAQAVKSQPKVLNDLKNVTNTTLAAPTDDAFKKLLDKINISAEDLLASEALPAILQYHVAKIKNETYITLLSGAKWNVSVAMDGKRTIKDGNNASAHEIAVVHAADKNDVIIIDAVLLPPGVEVKDNRVIIAQPTNVGGRMNSSMKAHEFKPGHNTFYSS